VFQGVPRPCSRCAGQCDGWSDSASETPPQRGRSCQRQCWARQQSARNCSPSPLRPA